MRMPLGFKQFAIAKSARFWESDMKPQLAVDIDFEKAKYPLIAQFKADGVELLILTEHLKARSLKPHENLFTTEKYSKDIYLGFDGELIVGAPNEEATLNRTSSATRTINWKGDISWYVFDWLHPEVVHLLILTAFTS